MSSPDVNDIQKVLQEVNSMKTDAMLFVGVVITIGLLYFGWRYWIGLKHEREIQKVKEKRAQHYSASLNNIASAMREQTDRFGILVQNLEEAVGTLDSSVQILQSNVTSLISRTAGTIGKEDSVRIIRDRFVYNVYRDFCYIIEKSLTENDYANRREFVNRKVKTAFSDVLNDARKYLCSYNLAVEPHKFFTKSPNQTAERLILCDLVWMEVEPLFRKELPLKQKIEEAFLLIENSISDYIEQCGYGTDIIIETKSINASATAVMRYASENP